MNNFLLLSKDFKKLNKLIEILEHFQKIEERTPGYDPKNDEVSYLFSSDEFNINKIKRLLSNSDYYTVKKEICDFGGRTQVDMYQIIFKEYSFYIEINSIEVLYATVYDAEYQYSLTIGNLITNNNREIINRLKSTVEKEMICSKISLSEDENIENKRKRI